MKNKDKKSKKVDSKSKEKDIKVDEVGKKKLVSMDHTLGASDEKGKKSKSSGLKISFSSKDIIDEAKIDDVSDFDVSDMLLEGEDEVQENLEEAVGREPVAMRRSQDDFSYEGRNDFSDRTQSVSYNEGSRNSGSNNISYSGTNQSGTGVYTSSNDAGGGYKETDGSYDNVVQQPSLVSNERVGEIRDTSSSALESKFVKAGKRESFQSANENRY